MQNAVGGIKNTATAVRGGPPATGAHVWAERYDRKSDDIFALQDGKRALTSYWRLPNRLYDDADELAQWARQALAAARQGAAVKPRAGKRRFNQPSN
jgi:hypothetical protein